MTLTGCIKTTNGGSQWYPDTMMQTIIYLGTIWYLFTKLGTKHIGKQTIKAAIWGPRDNI